MALRIFRQNKDRFGDDYTHNLIYAAVPDEDGEELRLYEKVPGSKGLSAGNVEPVPRPMYSGFQGKSPVARKTLKERNRLLAKKTGKRA